MNTRVIVERGPVILILLILLLSCIIWAWQAFDKDDAARPDSHTGTDPIYIAPLPIPGLYAAPPETIGDKTMGLTSEIATNDREFLQIKGIYCPCVVESPEIVAPVSINLSSWPLEPFASPVYTLGSEPLSGGSPSFTGGMGLIGTGSPSGGGFVVITNPTPTPPETALPVPLTPIPEPETWAMLVIGFGIVGVIMRRRRYIEVGG